MSREKFFKVYANLPNPERKQVIVVMSGEAYSWAQAENEIKEETKLGKQILEKMHRMGIL